MNGIGWAVKEMQGGARVRRVGWNGKGMWLAYSPGCVDCPAEKLWSEQNQQYAQENGGTATVLPYITMKTADGFIVPWLCSQTDLLAIDWEIAE